jgi:hypothetical protein
LLKKLYQYLLPRRVRHDLGEYYTPDWLADRLIRQIGYDGNPDKRILDPSCGSERFSRFASARRLITLTEIWSGLTNSSKSCRPMLSVSISTDVAVAETARHVAFVAGYYGMPNGIVQDGQKENWKEVGAQIGVRLLEQVLKDWQMVKPK